MTFDPAAAYATLVSHLVGSKRAFIDPNLCSHGQCEGHLSSEERAAIVSALPHTTVTFTSHLAAEGKRAHFTESGCSSVSLVSLGPIARDGDKLRIWAGVTRNLLCGFGGRYVLALKDGAWKVVAEVPGSQWIS